MRKLYHITIIENVQSILENGLKAMPYDEAGTKGVFLFDEKTFYYPMALCNADGSINTRYRPTWTVADKIALTQVGLKQFAMLEVTVDENRLINDNVGEWTASEQFIHHGDIDPAAIELNGYYKAMDKDQYQVFDTENEILCSKKESKSIWKEHKKGLEELLRQYNENSV